MTDLRQSAPATRDRSAEAVRADEETRALVELQRRSRRIRVWVLPIVIAGLALGVVGAGANATGYWPIFEPDEDGYSYVSKLTILTGFLLPALPPLGVALALYVFLRARVRSRWCVEYGGKHGIDRAFLERNSKRYG